MKTYMKKQFEYRRGGSLISGIITTTVGAMPFCIICWHLITDKSIDVTPLLVMKTTILFGVAGVFLYVGIFLLRSYRGNRLYTLEITDRGISYDGRIYEWGAIRSFVW